MRKHNSSLARLVDQEVQVKVRLLKLLMLFMKRLKSKENSKNVHTLGTAAKYIGGSTSTLFDTKSANRATLEKQGFP